MTFLESVQELTGDKGGNLSRYTPSPVPHESKILTMPDKGDDAKRVWAYLVQTRRIDKELNRWRGDFKNSIKVP
jgi:hypothetical protein